MQILYSVGRNEKQKKSDNNIPNSVEAIKIYRLGVN